MEESSNKSFALTGSGWEEFKRFFNNKNFVWFDRKSLRGEDSLSPQDAKWLRSWTFSPLGVASVFYIAYRKLYDIATIYIGTWLFFQVHDEIIRPLLINDAATSLGEKYPAGLLIGILYYFLVAIPISFVSFYSSYFLLRHGRRLSWNRGTWKTIEELRESERKWFRYNFLPSMVIVALSLWFLFSL